MINSLFPSIKLHIGYGVATWSPSDDGPEHNIRAHKDRIINVSKLTFFRDHGCLYLIVWNGSRHEVTISDWRLVSDSGGVMFVDGNPEAFRIDPKDHAIIALPGFTNSARKSSHLWRAEVFLGEPTKAIRSRQKILVPPQTKWGGKGVVGLIYNPSQVRKNREIALLAEQISAQLRDSTTFYRSSSNSYEETRSRLETFKHFIEMQGGFKLLHRNELDSLKEEDVQILFQAVWHGTPYAVSREVNNGRGPVDFAISMGAHDKCLVEFKLGSNTRLRHGLTHQVEIYKEANRTNCAFLVIIYATQQEEKRVKRLLRELQLEGRKDIVLIDARPDNKESASRSK
ncbi:hypothetical protein AB0K60_26230 [Thermopolyspora sp. NPDC052614]|uniref:hypothetical protein n=1 Tax=Thermopolyspora sp. NPDC052614 TaxID=3155682 RepID=UPI003412377A